VSTYNILADCHVVNTRDQCYSHVTDEYLLKGRDKPEESFRHKLLVKELDFLQSDVILLQEIDVYYAPHVQDYLLSKGYSFHFMQKKLDVPEGIAIAYRDTMFECLETHEVHLHEQIRKLALKSDVTDDVIQQLEEPNVSLVCALKRKDSQDVVICATTHVVYSDFHRPDLQALQACVTTQRILEIRDTVQRENNLSANEVHVVFGGDFNGEPSHYSISLMKRVGCLSPEELQDLAKLTYKLCEKQAVRITKPEMNLVSQHLGQHLTNPLELASSYHTVMATEPTVTSADGEYVGCLDYIFHSPRLVPLAVLAIGNQVESEYRKGGPTEQFASDHLPLRVQLACL